jgi:folate-binding protein YgfZ
MTIQHAAALPATEPDSEGLAAARHSAVVADLGPLGLLEFEGADAEPFLQGQLSNDVKALVPGVCQYTSYSTAKGRMLANLVLWRAAPTTFRALLAGDVAADVAKRLRVYVLRSKVAIADRSAQTFRLGIGGPSASTVMQSAFGVAPPPFAVATLDDTTLIGLPGRRWVAVGEGAQRDTVASRLTRHARPAGYAVWAWLTIDSGVPLIGAATQDQFVAQTANWDVLGGVSFQKGCYPGQEIVARTRYLGRLKERLFAYHAGSMEIAAGTRVFSAVFGDQPCGTVVNAAPSPEGGTDLLAVVQIAAADAHDIRLGSPEGERLAARALPYAIPAPPPPRRG